MRRRCADGEVLAVAGHAHRRTRLSVCLPLGCPLRYQHCSYHCVSTRLQLGVCAIIPPSSLLDPFLYADGWLLTDVLALTQRSKPDFITPDEEELLLRKLADTPMPKWKTAGTGRR